MKKITFESLMRKVTRCEGEFRPLKPYTLRLGGKVYRFADTSEIVPFVESLGWIVTGA